MKESLIWTEKRQCCRSDILPGNKFGSSSVLAKAKIGLRTANPWNIRYNSICHRTFVVPVERGNGKVLVKTMHVFYEHSTLHQPVCRRPPPSPPPQIKNRCLLQKASVLATLHEPTELRRLRSIECFHSRGQHLCKFIGTKESVCIRKELNSQRIGLGHQHGRRSIVLGHQYGRRDVMWKHSIFLYNQWGLQNAGSFSAEEYD